MVKVKRHLAKTISYRILSSSFGFFTMWYLTGDIRIGTAFSVAEIIIKTKKGEKISNNIIPNNLFKIFEFY